MNKLDNDKVIKKLDPKKVLASIEMLSKQFDQAWQAAGKIVLPAGYRNIDKIVVNGMGGSALGAQIIHSVFQSQMKLPFEIINSYTLPGTVDQRTLYIISSYSGSTEEPLATIAVAKSRGAKVIGITAGGRLAELIKKNDIAGYVFDPIFNPSAQPRIGLGYSIGAQLAILKKLGVLKVSPIEIKNLLNNLSRFDSKFGFSVPTAKNPAKQLAKKLLGKIPIVVASEFLSGNAHVLANQFNENAKTFSAYFLISELNHHLLEGLRFPAVNQKLLTFIFLESGLYQRKNQIRYKITKQVVTKNKISHLTYSLQSATKLAQAMEALAFGSYVSFYLAILNGINPAKIPFVDYFKTQLSRLS